MMYKTAVGVAAGVCGTFFLGYCIYFDRKRRSDPHFKQNLREKRAKALLSKKQTEQNGSRVPDLRDHYSVQKFFIEEVQLGEEALAQGNIESGIDHLGNALVVCAEPANVIEVLQQQLPPQIFQLLMQRLPIVSQKFARTYASYHMKEEDDVE